jgi:cell wall assembly regulator SMI1
MSDQLQHFLQDFEGNQGASEDSLNALEIQTGLQLPIDYREFMARYDGGEGFIGKQYLILWKAENIVRYNFEYQVVEYAPGLLLIGSSGGGEAFGFDTRDNGLPIVQVSFIGLDLRYAQKVADNFCELLSRMSESDGSLL